METAILQGMPQAAEQVLSNSQTGLSLIELIILMIVTIIITQLTNWMVGKLKRNANRKADAEQIKTELINTFADAQTKFREEILKQYMDVKAKNEELESNLESYKSEYSELLGEYKKIEGAHKELLSRYAELEAAHKELLIKYADIQKQLNIVHRELERTRTERDELHKEVKKLQSILNKMKYNKKKNH